MITNYAPSTGSTSYDPADSTVNSFDVYTYDALGNVLTDTNQDGEWAYAYDADSQLIQAIFTPNNTDPDGLTAQELQYVYDAMRQPDLRDRQRSDHDVCLNNVNEYTSSTTGGVTTTYQYDANGNLIAQAAGGSTTTYTYNELNLLTAVNGSGLTASYGYDPLGDLITQTIDGVVTSYQIDPAGLGNVVASFGADGALTAHYTYGLGLVSQVNAAGTTSYYDFNSIGSTVGMSGASGAYTNVYAYLPFGQTLTVVAAVSNPFTFVAQTGVINEGTGLYDMRIRTYDSVTGCFTQPDPLNIDGGNTNVRVYGDNNPISEIDPAGLESLLGYYK